ncbi:MAG: cation:proton antiporter [Bacteroidales bacterium]|nr:cation:proton antiporter [Bacteroidales bacterium]MCB8998588.1 cation:proton antiporter [Bacteroidales bacterium]MCB9012544.1 cation:proton antiporter [Bacteroidales bacterium]
MESILGMKLPIQDPLIVFLIILFFFLFAPLFAHRLKLPGIIGLILSGILLGPHGLNLISQSIGITLFGTVGLLYLMFLTGLEINLLELSKYRKQGIMFGLLTFFIPLSLGLILTLFVLHMPFKTGVLFASIFSTHTLVSYPIVGRYGLSQIKIAGITVAGTVITDTGALLILTVIASSIHGSNGWFFIARLVVFFLILINFSVFFLPKIGRWLLTRLQGEPGYQYIALLLLVFLTAFLAKILDIEPIIGAFFAGLALNKLVPQKSPLMNRVEFIGNNLFIPFFLLGVGMLIDLSVLISSPSFLIKSFIIISVAILGKFLASYAMQKIYSYSRTERDLMFGLSTPRAAATIAVVLVGFNLKLFDAGLMNEAILIILFTCLLGSVITEKAAQKLSHLNMQGEEKSEFTQPERILVPIANPGSIEYLMRFAFAIKTSGSKEPIYPLTVLHDDISSPGKIMQFNRNLERYQQDASSTEESISPMVRIDVSAVDGILRAIKEKVISKLVIGWNVKSSASIIIMGSLLEKLIEKAHKMLLIVHIDKSLESFNGLNIFIPPDFEKEFGFKDCISTFLLFSGRLKKKTVFYCEPPLQKYLFENFRKQLSGNTDINFKEFKDWGSLNNYNEMLEINDLLVFMTARPKKYSHPSKFENLPRILSRYYKEHNFVLVYPEDKQNLDDSLSSRLGTS